MSLLSIAFDTNIQLAPIIGATIAAIVVVIGWFIISYLNRRNEIAKELREYKLNILRSIINLRNDLMKNDKLSKKLYDEVSIHIQTFGQKDEIQAFYYFNDSFKQLENLEKIHEEFKNNQIAFKNILDRDRQNASKEIEDLIQEAERKAVNIDSIIPEREIQMNKIIDEINKNLVTLLDLCRDRIRKELKLEKLNPQELPNRI